MTGCSTGSPAGRRCGWLSGGSGCAQVLVAYSKFYVTGFKYRENDRELGLRAVHVHL
jgi:hypothetical protein